MTMLLGPALGGVRHPDVDMWMAAKGATGAAALLDFAGQKYGFRSAAGVPRWGSVAEDMVFSRASTASYIDANGAIQFAASGQPRYSHDVGSLAPIGLLIESSRTNSFVNAVWGGPATPTSWAAQNPEGISVVPSKFGPNVGARRFTATGNRPNIRQVVTLTAGVTYTASVMVEAISASTSAFFTMFANVANTTVTFPSCAANPAGGMNGALQPGLLVMQIVSTVTQSATVVVGAGVVNVQAGLAIDLSMPQIEAGNWPTSFIPGGVRAAETLSMALPIVPANGFTVAFRAKMPLVSNVGDANQLFNFLPPSGTTNRIGVETYGGVGTLWYSRYPTGLGTQTQRMALGIALGGGFYGAIAWSASQGYRGTAIGGAAVKNASLPAPVSELSRISIGSRDGSSHWNNAIERIAVWSDGDLTDDQMRSLLAA